MKRSFVNNRHDNKLILIDQIKSELLHAEKVLDLIGLKYEFIRLKVGECDLGLYAFEEHFNGSAVGC